MRDEARSEAVATEIMGPSPELAAARAARVPRRITGTIRVRFETGAGGSLRRMRVARLEIERTNGERETRTTTETIERRPVTPRS